MFTGIVEELGRVRSVRPNEGGARITVEADRALADLELGGSVAVNGCCLTAVEIADGAFSADCVTETLRRTSLGALSPGDRVNLERPVRADGRLDGHVVQGHVDAVGTIEARDARADGSFALRIVGPADVLRYVVEKGAVAVDGVSLTVVGVDERGFEIALIPHTAEETTLGHTSPGDPVNIEVDVLAKYVERLMTTGAPHPGASEPGE